MYHYVISKGNKNCVYLPKEQTNPEQKGSRHVTEKNNTQRREHDIKLSTKSVCLFSID